jgi:hypothetical protein
MRGGVVLPLEHLRLSDRKNFQRHVPPSPSPLLLAFSGLEKNVISSYEHSP